ncbi:MAG TPA: serine hydrolase domain-containing protein [Pyrinomonadaceae bacterium]|nr:serine hydrolase domain-containing protein [Pyrinomonadaceae bacterium]
MARIVMTIALALMLETAALAQAGAAANGERETLAASVDQLFAQWDKPDTPGCALAVIKDGDIVYRRGYGAANLELSVPLTPASVFNVGSIAKQFTAMSILMLEQQGKLSLDDAIRKYLPEVPDFGTPITLRHLMQHTSGLRDLLEMREMAGWRIGDLTTEKDVLDMVSRQRTLNHPPGEEFLYTNTGYVLLAVVVKRVAGQSLREFAEANIFKPLGMNSTHFYDSHRAIIKGLVDGYVPHESGFLKWMPADDHIGSSNLYTTVEDLARWDKNFYDGRVGGAALLELMLTPGTLNDGFRLEYAHGLYVTSYKGLKTVVHNGSSLGYQGTLHRYPEQRFSVALLCNVRGNNPDALARRVADLYLAEQFKQTATASRSDTTLAPPQTVKLSEQELSRVAGLYWNPVADTVRRVYLKEGKLMYFRAPGNESELAPLGDNRFLMLGARNRVEISFKSPRPGAPLQMFFSEAGSRPSVQETVPPASYEPRQLNEFAGTYYSPELDTTYTLTPDKDRLLLRTGNWGDFLLSPRFVDSFANPQEMGSIVFTRDEKKRVSGFVIRSGKVRNLRFDKTR